jgi:hypothetical protein
MTIKRRSILLCVLIRTGAHNLRYAPLLRYGISLHNIAITVPQFTSTAIMPKRSCCSCSALESQDVLFSYCATCTRHKVLLFQSLSKERLGEVAHANLQASPRGKWKHAGTDYVHVSCAICTRKLSESQGLKIDEDGSKFFKLARNRRSSKDTGSRRQR